jgi:hypothetical protein
MSFSNDVRNELARLMPGKSCCCKSELAALVNSNGSLEDTEKDSILLKVTAENAATARKIFLLLKESYKLPSRVQVEKSKRFKKSRRYEVNTYFKQNEKWIIDELIFSSKDFKAASRIKSGSIKNNCCKRAFLRGVFLSRGFINRPEGEYHLEIAFSSEYLLKLVQNLLLNYDVQARSIERKHHLGLYIKESEKIADFLRIAGANQALLEFENVRIIKSMRNSVNRQVNCETANLAKTVDASIRQVDLIEKLIKENRLQSLSPQLKELAMLRINFPDNSLKELGLMLDPPLSKSGVAYRMRKLEALAETVLSNTK